MSTLLNGDERVAMEFFIACAPQDHPVIAGTGGFRKARWARRGKGKSGGFRVVGLHGRNLRQIENRDPFGG